MTPPASDEQARPDLPALPDNDAHPCLAGTEGRRLRWDGRPPVSPGWFEMRPSGLTRDTRPVYDEDLDCVVGYYRSFGHRGYVYDLLGEIVSITYLARPDRPRESRRSW